MAISDDRWRELGSERPYFDASVLPDSIPSAYVAWIDVMGTMNIMSRSIAKAANFVMKIHIACVESLVNDAVTLYPIMDGVYVYSRSQYELRRFLNRVMRKLALSFIMERKERPYHHFLVKSSVAYGPVAQGSKLWRGSNCLCDGVGRFVSDCMLVGVPLVQAYSTERLAAPFGVYVHESARSFSPHRENPWRTSGVHWRWHNESDEEEREIFRRLGDEIDLYYAWVLRNNEMMPYSRERAEDHRRMARQYFNVDDVIS